MGFEWAWDGIDWIAAVVSVMASMALGFIWYSKFAFLKVWQEDTGMDPSSGQPVASRPLPSRPQVVGSVSYLLFLVRCSPGASRFVRLVPPAGLCFGRIDIDPELLDCVRD